MCISSLRHRLEWFIRRHSGGIASTSCFCIIQIDGLWNEKTSIKTNASACIIRQLHYRKNNTPRKRWNCRTWGSVSCLEPEKCHEAIPTRSSPFRSWRKQGNGLPERPSLCLFFSSFILFRLKRSNPLAEEHLFLWHIFGHMFSIAFARALSARLAVFGHRIHGHQYVSSVAHRVPVHRIVDIDLANAKTNSVGGVRLWVRHQVKRRNVHFVIAARRLRLSRYKWFFRLQILLHRVGGYVVLGANYRNENICILQPWNFWWVIIAHRFSRNACEHVSLGLATNQVARCSSLSSISFRKFTLSLPLSL